MDKLKLKYKLKEKTGQITRSLPLSKNSIEVIKKYLMGKDQDEFIFMGQMTFINLDMIV